MLSRSRLSPLQVRRPQLYLKRRPKYIKRPSLKRTWDSGARYLLVCTSHIPGQSSSYMGRKETCDGRLTCPPPIPSIHMSFSHQNLQKTHCLSSLILPSLWGLSAALTPAPSILSFQHLKSSPHCACFPCCCCPQGPLSSMHLQ